MANPDAPIGYGLVARYMADADDLSMFRRFRALNTRNLLLMQSELRVLG